MTRPQLEELSIEIRDSMIRDGDGEFPEIFAIRARLADDNAIDQFWGLEAGVAVPSDDDPEPVCGDRKDRVVVYTLMGESDNEVCLRPDLVDYSLRHFGRR